MSQSKPKKYRGKKVVLSEIRADAPGLAGVPKSPTTRKKFLEAYEATCGNVTLSCEQAGISRKTFYRWMGSTTAVNLKFQRQLARIKPKERLVDICETALLKRVREGSDTLIKFGLSTQGSHRGWGEAARGSETVERIAAVFRQFLAENAHMATTAQAQMYWIGVFARQAGVPPFELAKQINPEFARRMLSTGIANESDSTIDITAVVKAAA
jgi:hypothetical protein